MLPGVGICIFVLVGHMWRDSQHENSWTTPLAATSDLDVASDGELDYGIVRDSARYVVHACIFLFDNLSDYKLLNTFASLSLSYKLYLK